MDNQAESRSRSWAEKNGGTILGGGVFVLLLLLAVLMAVYGEA